jgi:hypothetical protein
MAIFKRLLFRKAGYLEHLRSLQFASMHRLS